MFQTEEEATENERSPSVAVLCAGLLRRGMVCELERVCNGFLCSMSVTYCGISKAIINLHYTFSISRSVKSNSNYVIIESHAYHYFEFIWMHDFHW